MASPYRILANVEVYHAPKEPLRCQLGWHRIDSFTIGPSYSFFCDGFRIRFFCACGKMLKEHHRLANRPVVVRVPPNWEGMAF